jgi:hypothetical protein
MATDNILDFKRLEVRKTVEPDEEILDLLKHTVLGAEGGMQYSMQNIPSRIKDYGKSIYFMSLYKKNSLTGVIGLCKRVTTTAGKKYNSTHLRYLSFRSAFQTEEGAGVRKERPSHFQESFKLKVLSMFSKPYDFPERPEDSGEKHVMYAYVESKNERSKNLINQAGYEYIRSFLTVAFSRFTPRADKRVTKLNASGIQEMKEILNSYYSGYSFYTDEFSFFNNGYYVLRENNEIIAGVCVIPTSYRVVNIPGVWGWILMKMMPRAPYFRRLFRPGEFRYLVLGALYCREGKEDVLPDLFEAVCAAEGFNTALTWLDDHSSLYEKLRTNRRMGTLNRILNAKPGLVYASFSNLSAEEKEKFYDSPAYISGFDFS